MPKRRILEPLIIIQHLFQNIKAVPLYFLASSVGISTERTAGVDYGKEKIFYNFQTGSMVHQRAPSPGIKRQDRETDHSPPSNV
jgi:hypothetical protein